MLLLNGHDYRSSCVGIRRDVGNLSARKREEQEGNGAQKLAQHSDDMATDVG